MMATVYRVAEVADLLQCSTASVYRLVADGRLQAFNIGRDTRGLRITGAALEDFMTALYAEPDLSHQPAKEPAHDYRGHDRRRRGPRPATLAPNPGAPRLPR